jgi:DNA-directed RNA polymerase subunit N (RpoN/RPB10)
MTCGKPVANKYLEYLDFLREEKEVVPNRVDGSVNITRQEFLEKKLGLKRYCCKKEITTSVNLMDKI